MYKLVISDDEGKTTTVPLVRDEITIGRKEGNTIRLTDRNVSRRHAKLQKQNGGYVLQDLGSYNGTVINGTRLSDQRALKMGDQIVIGDYKLNIVEESAAQVAPAATPAPTAAVVETFEAPAQQGGHHPQATMPAIPTALGVPPPATIAVPEQFKKLQLVFLAPAGTPSPFTINKLPILLGRSEIADISLPFSSISREHAKVTLEGDQLVIEDLGSSNGVMVNGEKVKKHPIKAGDALTMGVVECKVARIGEATALAPMPSAALAAEPEMAAPAKKSSVGMLVGIGVLVAVLGGGGAVVAMRGSTPTNTANNSNSTVVTGNEPTATPATNNNAAQTAQQPAQQTAQQPAQQAQPTGDPPANNGSSAGATEPANTVAANTPPQTDPPANNGSANTVAQNDPPTQPTRTGDPVRTRVRPTANNTDPPNGAQATNPPNGTGTVAATTRVATQTQNTQPSNPTSSGTAPAQNVGQCLLNNDFQCVVSALRNRAGTEVEFNQLVTAYKGLHNQAAAEQTMRRYLSRFPDGRYAERYRDMLNQ